MKNSSLCSHRIAVAAALAASTLTVAPIRAQTDNTAKPPIEAALAQPSPNWAQRASAPTEEKAIAEFLDMLVLDGSIRKPLLLETATLAKTDKKAAFENYLEKFLQRLENAEYNGLDEAMSLNDKPEPAEKIIKAAERLMDGIVILDNKTIHIGEPGQVDWSAPWDTNKVYPGQVSLHTSAVFTNLARAFLLTNDRKYLVRWFAYLDDWTLNDNYFDTLHPLDTPDHVNSQSAFTIINTMKLLSRVQEPARGAQIPPRILAQVIRRFLLEMLPYTVTYIRSNTHNWTPSTRMLSLALIFEDFEAAQFYYREGLRRNIEDHAVTQNLRDGTENQQDHWYNAYYLDISDVFKLLETDSSLLGWKELKKDYEWRERMQRYFKERATYLIHDRTPQNNLPLAWNGGYNRTPETGEYSEAPAAWHDPVNQEILRAVNGEATADPGFHSEWFPYGGFNIVRDGWDKKSGYGAMFTSPQPGAYGGFRSRSNNNVLTLNAYGQDLLIDDATGHYMYPTSPIRVDGRNQFFHTGIYKVEAPQNHKVFQVNAWQQPAPWRWHASDNFNLMEGIYSGAFAKLSDASRVEGPYGTDESLSGTLPAGTGINDVSHQRLTLYVRDAKLWIIDDRMRSKSAHEYSQQWIFPLRPADDTPPKEIRTGPAFRAEKIVLDAAAKKIATSEPTVPVKSNDKMVDSPKVNLSLHQFSTAPLEYSTTVEPRGKEYGYYMYYSRGRVQTKWQGSGDQQVITLAFPRAPGAGPEGDVKITRQITSGKSGLGFEAVTPEGQTIKYLSSVTPDDTLTLDNISIQGEALLLSGGKGMALGAGKMTIGGQAVKLPAADFEFTLNGANNPSLTPIYRPLSPVEIGPQSNIFADRVLVTLTSPTPGVEIRYTLGGQEPTPQSPLYTQPLALTKSTTVLARAYRPGLSQNPPQQSGTHATPVSSARFEKSVVSPAINPPRPESGLNVKYIEGDWQKLLLDAAGQPAVATKNGVKLWDTSAIPAANPLVAKTAGARAKPYALEYSGFLNVPQTGVYTLHAPAEYVWPAVDAGYELNVSLGNKIGTGVFAGRVVGKNEWYPSTRHHGFGTWSVALEKGIHPLRIVFADYRTDAAKRLNRTNIAPFVWEGTTPELHISGPGMEKQPIPEAWLLRPMER